MIVFDVESGKCLSIRGRKDVQDLEAWPLWNKRKQDCEYSFEVPHHPISHKVTEEAKEGQIVYDQYLADKEAEKQKKIREQEELKKKVEAMKQKKE